MRFQKNNRKPDIGHSSRLNIVLAAVFLLGGIVIYRLFELQFINFDYYDALASQQHAVSSELKPRRGVIYFKDKESSPAEVYPAAMNKEFAFVYAVPEKIDRAQEAAQALYQIFDEEKVKEEVAELLSDDEYFKTLFSGLEFKDEKAKLEFLKVKEEAEIKLRKEAVIKAYQAKLEKEGDPFEPLQKKVDERRLASLLAYDFSGIEYMMQSSRFYPENDLGAHLLGFVGYSGDEEAGRYGLEGFFNEELAGRPGSVKAGRSAEGEVIIVNDREYEKPVNGSDLILTIDRSIQFEACRQLRITIEESQAESGSVIVMEPYTGAILAMCSVPSYNPNLYNEVEDGNVYNNPVIFDAYEPGSIFKVFTMAAGLNENAVSPNTFYDDRGFVMVEGWPKPIKNSDYESKGGHGRVSMLTVLEESLNTGTIFVVNRIGAEKFAGYVENFGFGEKTGIELETEGLTNIKNLQRSRIRPVEAATASFGQGISATPLQLAAALSAIANGGILMKPYLVDEIVPASGEGHKTVPQKIRRVISEKAAVLLSGMMVKVVEDGHAKRAGVKGYFVAGKTGTAQVADDKGGYSSTQAIHSFAGFAPVEEPRFVMITKIKAPKADWAESTAAPLFGRIADFILNYYQVPKER